MQKKGWGIVFGFFFFLSTSGFSVDIEELLEKANTTIDRPNAGGLRLRLEALEKLLELENVPPITETLRLTFASFFDSTKREEKITLYPILMRVVGLLAKRAAPTGVRAIEILFKELLKQIYKETRYPTFCQSESERLWSLGMLTYFAKYSQIRGTLQPYARQWLALEIADLVLHEEYETRLTGEVLFPHILPWLSGDPDLLTLRKIESALRYLQDPWARLVLEQANKLCALTLATPDAKSLRHHLDLISSRERRENLPPSAPPEPVSKN